MSGITGIAAFNLVGKFNKIHITAATTSMARRGPDYQDIYIDDRVGLGHRRLSIIDTSEKAHQPMWDESRRYCITFDGEIFNFQELKKDLENEGVRFQSHSDTEVLLQLFIRYQERCLSRLNGFFAFCIYDKQTGVFFIARDRYGVKPLLYLYDEDKFIYASEMKTILQYGIDKTLDYTSLITYLQLNYIPAPDTIFSHVKKLLPGHYIILSGNKLGISRWYEIPYDAASTEKNIISYADAKNKFAILLEDAVKQRLVADVPLGCFLSGDLDSSVITGLASRHKPGLHTFSIGFPEGKFFDETGYATRVAKHFKTDHTVFSFTNRALYENVEAVLNHIDEPFADPSAINLFILSKETRMHATVALSGDGANELLAGSHRHEALYRMLHPGWKESALASLWKILPKYRNNRADRFSSGATSSAQERYWQCAMSTDAAEAIRLLNPSSQSDTLSQEVANRKSRLLNPLTTNHNMNEILLTEMQLVLANDILVKADCMSMANSLEIRSPFLDYRLVDFAFTLPDDFKVSGNKGKIILRHAFHDMLPAKIYNRPKKGFEVPLLKWFRNEMKSLITDDLLSQKQVEEQGIFSYPEIEKLKRKLFSSNPGDVHVRIWALVVFQWWWKKYVNQ